MQWIGVNKERILKELPGYEEASKWAAEQLGFAVTKHNLQSVARDSDQSWVPKPADRNGKSYSVVANIANRVNGMAGQLDECKKLIEQLLTDNQTLHAQLAVLRGAVVTMAKQAGIPAPSFAARHDAPGVNVAKP